MSSAIARAAGKGQTRGSNRADGAAAQNETATGDIEKTSEAFGQGATMKPGDHPEFFRFPAPPGASRESTIRLDGGGRFWHDGAPVENPALSAALHGWISRHPDDGRYILTNGYDWTYFEVEDVPYFVVSVGLQAEGIRLRLSDGSEEWLDGSTLAAGGDGGLYLRVKGGSFEARLTRHAQASLEPVLVEVDGEVGVRVGERVHRVAPR